MMKSALLAAALVLGGLGATAQAGPFHARVQASEVVDGWYHQYLGRCADTCGLRSWTEQLRCGKSPECVLSHILGSDEYYQRNGCCAAGFIKGLYRDHLGRCATACEVQAWLKTLNCCRSRQELALKFLCASRRELTMR